MEFTYKGLKIDRETWENAPAPIDCSAITDEQMKQMVKDLYYILHRQHGFSESDIQNYAKAYDNTDLCFKIDLYRWQEEEELFIENGGVYV